MSEFWEKYKNLIIFVIISFSIMSAAFCIGLSEISGIKSNLWGFLAALDTSTAIALAVLAFMAYMEYAKGEDDIKLKFEILDESGNVIDTKYLKSNGENLVILRKNATRAEVLGIMGMIQKSSTGRYEIDNRIQKRFLDKINEIQKGKGGELLIPIIKKDYDKFFNLD
jgi:1,4-dihydroxy-2-naphthoate octaprenyltransferase